MARTPRDHAADAGGDPELLAAKAAVRDEVWARVSAPGIVRFPGARHRIPNFVGAEAAAACLAGTLWWRDADVIKANPDSPQRPVRKQALTDGITVLMAVPRLASDRPFWRLDPAVLTASPHSASLIAGAEAHGDHVAVSDIEPIDLVVTGCVAVGTDGARLGKGGGFADLELALLGAAGLIGPDTRVATTVHPVQVVEAGRIPVDRHDSRVDLIVTPDEVIDCGRQARSPGIIWSALTPEKIAAIPLLARLAAQH